MSGCQLGFVLGREQVLYARPQTNAAYVLPEAGPPTATAGGAMHVVSSDIDPKRPNTPRRDARLGPFDSETYQERFEGAWQAVLQCIPPTAMTARCDAHHLLKAVFGASTFVSGTSNTYALTNSALCTPLSLLRLANRSASVYSEALRLALVNSMKLVGESAKPPEMTFEGFFAEWVGTGKGVVDETNASQTEIDVESATIDNFMVGSTYGSRIQIGANTNGGSGYEVTDVDRTNDDITVGTAVSVTDGDIILPYAPTPTLSTSPLIGFEVGGMTLDGLAVPVKSYEISIARNLDLNNDQIFTDTYDDATFGYADLMATFVVDAGEDWTPELARAYYREERALVLAIGESAGRTWTLNMPQFQPDPTKIALSGAGRGEIQISGRLLASSEGALDAINLVQT